MNIWEITAQLFGIAGLAFSAWSFQEKENKKFFIAQGLSGLMFAINFLMINAVSAALFNVTNLIRGVLLSKNDGKPWRLIVIEALYTACFVFALGLIKNNPFQIFLSALTYAALTSMTVLMWKGNGKHIRYLQVFFVSPAWIVHNIFNFTLGGILCEVFAMISTVISFIRFGKDGFEKGKR